MLGTNATAEQYEKIEDELGLNDPLIEQYGRYMGNLLTGDLGQSYVTGQDVSDLVTSRLPVTLSLAIVATLVSLVAGVLIGTFAAIRSGPADRVVTSLSGLGLAIPSFWLAVVLVLVFGIRLQWLPATDYVRITDSSARVGSPPRAPGRRAGVRADRERRPSDAQRDDPGHGARLHPDAPRQRVATAIDHLEARAAQRGDPGGDRGRSAVRRRVRRRDHHRARLRPPGRRHADPQRRNRQRRAGRARRGGGDRGRWCSSSTSSSTSSTGCSSRRSEEPR